MVLFIILLTAPTLFMNALFAWGGCLKVRSAQKNWKSVSTENKRKKSIGILCQFSVILRNRKTNNTWLRKIVKIHVILVPSKVFKNCGGDLTPSNNSFFNCGGHHVHNHISLNISGAIFLFEKGLNWYQKVSSYICVRNQSSFYFTFFILRVCVCFEEKRHQYWRSCGRRC